ncbi:hypothetical protein FCV25MIE_08652 [Fagus crenata]
MGKNRDCLGVSSAISSPTQPLPPRLSVKSEYRCSTMTADRRHRRSFHRNFPPSSDVSLSLTHSIFGEATVYKGKGVLSFDGVYDSNGFMVFGFVSACDWRRFLCGGCLMVVFISQWH